MPRCRSTARVVKFDGPGSTPAVLLDLFEIGDPAIDTITEHVLARRAAGGDVADPVVLAECVRTGRLAYAEQGQGQGMGVGVA